MNNVDQAAAVQRAPVILAPSKPGWLTLPLWQWALLLGLCGYLYYQITGKLVEDWWIDPNFSHGFFVPLFSGFLIWEERDKLSRIPAKFSWLGLPIIAGSLGVLVVGVLGAELFLQRTSMILLAAGMIIFFLGWRFFRAVLFPWVFLFLMVPIPAILFNQITFPLQLLASQLASSVLPVFGVPVLREGNVIQLPSMPLEVAEACSGIRSLISLFTLAVIYGYFLEPKVSRRVLLALAALPIAVAANAFRIVGTGLMVQFWDPDKALGFFHEFSGWVIFIISLSLLFGFHTLLRYLFHDRTGEAAA